jgi:ADP-heptose:LPS heptosyltransferase
MVESVVWLAARCARTTAARPASPQSIFVLRNNDIGDLVAITPVFEALKKCFPLAKIIAGVGAWNLPVLANNPFIDQAIEINAPWHNKFVCKSPHNSPRGFLNSWHYVFTSNEVQRLKELHCDIGIDILGSPEGSLMMMRAGIPWRLGVKGYAGGHSACQQNVVFDEEAKVGRTALRFAELLGAASLPESRPQLFLTKPEKSQAVQTWNALNQQGVIRVKRIMIAPGGGIVEKCWPRQSYRQLAAQLALQRNIQIVIVGSQSDYELGEFVRGASNHVANLCGKTSLRETFALVWAADGLVCNSSMVLHTAAAFDKPTIVLLGRTFGSARKHKQLWGYGANDLHLGCEPERNRTSTVEEVTPILKSHFQLE